MTSSLTSSPLFLNSFRQKAHLYSLCCCSCPLGDEEAEPFPAPPPPFPPPAPAPPRADPVESFCMWKVPWIDLQLQGGGDGLHAHHAAEARQRIAEVRVHLAVLYELLFTLQRHLTDSTGASVQTFTVGHLQRGIVCGLFN